MSIELRVTVDKLPQILERLPGAVSEILRKVSFDVVAEAQERSRVDTGQMCAGWTAEQTGEQEWTVSNPVEHAIYNELGTVHMSAQPMLTPAIEHQRQSFEDAFSALEGMLDA